MKPTSILITGASGGIGHALATALAAPGVTLHLAGRDEGRLGHTEKDCAARGAIVRPQLIDVTEREAMAEWIGSVGPLDLVIANAGIAAGTGGGKDYGLRECSEQVRAIFATNLDGVLNTILPSLDIMDRQMPDKDGIRGRIVSLASVASFLAFPGVPSYAASKAAVDYWTTATAPSARARGIIMTSVCPGFVESGMTANNAFPMPGLMSAERASRIILNAVASGKRRVTFPWWMGAGARLLQLLPPALTTIILARQKTMEPMPPP
jgi:NAD(P)-dependent dehydrogenase (short-subunit alcohol dehydrogenase family)